MKLDFFTSVKRIDWYDPYKYVNGARAIFYNWNSFLRMFEMRNELVHEMKYPAVTYGKLASLCDNTMNFLDATVFILDLQFRESVIARLQSNKTLRQRNAIIDRFLKLSA